MRGSADVTTRRSERVWMHTRYSPFYAALMIHALTCYLQRNNRGGALVEQHAAKTARESGKDDGEDDGPPKIWDHGRDMALSGRLMDDKSRDKYIKDARGLGDRFGTGKSGGFL